MVVVEDNGIKSNRKFIGNHASFSSIEICGCFYLKKKNIAVKSRQA